MDNVAHELALIVCKQCSRIENESDVDFSKRLYSVYNSCKSAIEDISNKEDADSSNNSVEEYLKMHNN